MKKGGGNYAFIDSQNLNKGVEGLGWKLDYKRFRVYLRDKYGVGTAYLFIGYASKYQGLYSALQRAGYILHFKPTITDGQGSIKGNVDADLVLQAVTQIDRYDGAVISPYVRTCSSLLRKEARGKMFYLDTLQHKLQYQRHKKSTA